MRNERTGNCTNLATVSILCGFLSMPLVWHNHLAMDRVFLIIRHYDNQHQK